MGTLDGKSDAVSTAEVTVDEGTVDAASAKGSVPDADAGTRGAASLPATDRASAYVEAVAVDRASAKEDVVAWERASSKEAVDAGGGGATGAGDGAHAAA